MEYLFVYGTLMRTHPNAFSHRLREQAEFFDRAVFSGRLYRIDWYPGAVDGTDPVYGELYAFSNHDLLDQLDRYEECSPDFPEPHEYRREKRYVRTPDGRTVEAWIWLYNHPTENCELIPDGQFRMIRSS